MTIEFLACIVAVQAFACVFPLAFAFFAWATPDRGAQ